MVTYAKQGPEDLCITVSATNHGPTGGAVAPAAADLAAQHLGVGSGPPPQHPAPTAAAHPVGRRPGSGRVQARPARLLLPGRRGHAGGAVLRQRDQCRRTLRRCQEHLEVHQGRHQQPGRQGRHQGGQPGELRHQGGLLVRPRPGRTRRDRRGAAPALAHRAGQGHLRPRLRERVRRAETGGGRVLRHGDPPGPVGLRPAHRPSRLCRSALGQAALPLQRRRMDPRRPDRIAGPGFPQGQQRQEPALGPARPCRRHLHAGRVGVPLVRRLGPGLPRDSAGPRRPGLRQGTTGADVPGMVDAPQRPVAGLRMGVRRRQPAGPRLGGLARLPDRRLPRPGLPDPGVHQAAAQLLLVDQPQGRRRVERLRGRVPRDGQHRPVQPIGQTAARVPAGTVRRHQLDGLLLPADVQDRPRAVPARPGLGRDGHQVPGALPVDRQGDELLRFARHVAVA